MARTIDADALLKRVVGNGLKPITEQIFHKLIDDEPTIDAVSVVRCKECRYKDMELCAMYKLVAAGVRKYDDFCSYGERKDHE